MTLFGAAFLAFVAARCDYIAVALARVINPPDSVSADGAKLPQTNPEIYMFQGDGDEFVYKTDLPYQIEITGRVVPIPGGFVTDYASVPEGARMVLSQIGKHSMAAVLHDFLYWDQSCTREEADLLFYEAMTENSVSGWRKSIAYWALRWFGGAAWNSNQEERKQRKPRIVPAKYFPIPPNTRWADFRAYLISEGITADLPQSPPTPPPAYCGLRSAAAGGSKP